MSYARLIAIIISPGILALAACQSRIHIDQMRQGAGPTDGAAATNAPDAGPAPSLPPVAKQTDQADPGAAQPTLNSLISVTTTPAGVTISKKSGADSASQFQIAVTIQGSTTVRPLADFSGAAQLDCQHGDAVSIKVLDDAGKPVDGAVVDLVCDRKVDQNLGNLHLVSSSVVKGSALLVNAQPVQIAWEAARDRDHTIDHYVVKSFSGSTCVGSTTQEQTVPGEILTAAVAGFAEGDAAVGVVAFDSVGSQAALVCLGNLSIDRTAVPLGGLTLAAGVGPRTVRIDYTAPGPSGDLHAMAIYRAAAADDPGCLAANKIHDLTDFTQSSYLDDTQQRGGTFTYRLCTSDEAGNAWASPPTNVSANAEGRVQWQVTADFNNTAEVDDEIDSITVDQNGDDYVTSASPQMVTGAGTNSKDLMIRKFAADGSEISAGWHKMLPAQISGDVSNRLVWAAVDDQNKLYVAVPAPSAYVHIWKFNPDGTSAGWTSDLPYSATSFQAFAVGPSGEVYLSVGGNNLANASSGPDVVLHKFDRNGSEISLGWNKILDTGGEESVNDMAVDAGGALYIGGIVNHPVSGFGHPSLFIRKFQPDGTEIVAGWNKAMSPGAGSEAYASRLFDRLVIDPYGDIYVFGTIQSLQTASSMGLLIKKYAANGNEYTTATGWNKSVELGSVTRAYDVAFNSAGDFYVGGTAYNYVAAGSKSDGWIAKFARDGTPDLSWNMGLSNSNSSSDEERVTALAYHPTTQAVAVGLDLMRKASANSLMDGVFQLYAESTPASPVFEDVFSRQVPAGAHVNSAYVDRDGYTYISGNAGSLISPSSGQDIFLRKYDANGQRIGGAWDAKIFDLGGAPTGGRLAGDSQNNIYLAASIHDDNVYLKKFSADGTEITAGWNKSIPCHDGASVLLTATNDDVILVSDTLSSDFIDLVVTRFDKDGNTLWTKTINASAGSFSWDIFAKAFLDSADNVHVLSMNVQVASEIHTIYAPDGTILPGFFVAPMGASQRTLFPHSGGGFLLQQPQSVGGAPELVFLDSNGSSVGAIPHVLMPSSVTSAYSTSFSFADVFSKPGNRRMFWERRVGKRSDNGSWETLDTMTVFTDAGVNLWTGSIVQPISSAIGNNGSLGIVPYTDGGSIFFANGTGFNAGSLGQDYIVQRLAAP